MAEMPRLSQIIGSTFTRVQPIQSRPAHSNQNQQSRTFQSNRERQIIRNAATAVDRRSETMKQVNRLYSSYNNNDNYDFPCITDDPGFAQLLDNGGHVPVESARVLQLNDMNSDGPDDVTADMITSEMDWEAMRFERLPPPSSSEALRSTECLNTASCPTADDTVNGRLLVGSRQGVSATHTSAIRCKDQVDQSRDRMRRRDNVIMKNRQSLLKSKVDEIENDPTTEVINLNLNNSDPVTYVQNVSVRYLKPPTPVIPVIVIKECRAQSQRTLSPIVISQKPLRAKTPPPIILREAPPTPPKVPGPQVFNKMLPPLPTARRQVILKKYPSVPAKPRDIIFEKWLPYSNLPKRRIIYSKINQDQEANNTRRPRDVIIHYELAPPKLTRMVKPLGVQIMDPESYLHQHGRSLLQHGSVDDLSKKLGIDLDRCVPKSETYTHVPRAASASREPYRVTGVLNNQRTNRMPVRVNQGNPFRSMDNLCAVTRLNIPTQCKRDEATHDRQQSIVESVKELDQTPGYHQRQLGKHPSSHVEAACSKDTSSQRCQQTPRDEVPQRSPDESVLSKDTTLHSLHNSVLFERVRHARLNGSIDNGHFGRRISSIGTGQRSRSLSAITSI